MDLLYQNPIVDTLGSPVVSLVNYLLLIYFSQYYCVCVIKATDDYILLDGTVPTMVITVDETFNVSFQKGVDNGCQAFVVSEQALWRFLDMFTIVHDLSDQRSAGKKLIVLLDDLNTFNIQRMCDHPSIKELPDMLIIVPQGGNKSVELFTTYIFSNGSRGSFIVQIRPVNPPDYFPDKATNMNGIPIRFRTIMYMPFAYYENTTVEKANARYDPQYDTDDTPVLIDGSEGLLLVEFCHKYNCSVEAYFDEVELWGTVYANHTGPGMLGAVATRKADFAVAAIYHWMSAYRFATYTVPISRSGATVLVPKPQILAPWRTPFLSFSGYLWLAVGVAFIVGVFGVWLIEKGRFEIKSSSNDQPKTLSDCILTLIGFYMEQSAFMRNDLTSCVFLFTSLLFAGFMIGNMYGAGLAGIMTIPQYEHAIDTVLDLADSGMAWAGTDSAWIFAIQQAPQPYLITLLKNFLVVDNEVLQRHGKTRDLGFIGERSQYGHFGPIDYLDEDSADLLRLLKDDLFWESCAALVTKTCPFKQHFNDLLMTIRQSGIQHYWELRAANRYMDMAVERKVLNGRQSSAESDATALTLLHFMGAFLILSLGYALGTVMFIFECLYDKLITQKINGKSVMAITFKK